MNQKKVRLVIVGFGNQAKTDHLPAIEKNPTVDLVGILDPFLVGSYKQIPVFKSIEELDESKLQYDAALISTPHNLHFQNTKDFLNRSKQVFKEKPAATSSDELLELCQIAEDNNVCLMVNVQRRLMDHYQQAKNILDELGEIFLIEGKYSIFVPDPGDGWRGEKEIAGGGCIIDMGYHLIDLLTFYFGLPSEITALTSNKALKGKKYSAEDTAVILFKYNNKIKANGSLIISRFSGPKNEYLKITGSNGILEICKNQINLKKNSGEDVLIIKNDKNISPINHFIDVLINKRSNLLSAKSHLMNLSFIKACYQSVKTGHFEKTA